MDLNQASGTTTAFYTLHSCDGEIALQIAEVLSLGDNEKCQSWIELIQENPSLEQRLTDQGNFTAIKFEFNFMG